MDKYHYEYEGIRLVVIDGIADLVLSANDEAESIRIVDEYVPTGRDIPHLHC